MSRGWQATLGVTSNVSVTNLAAFLLHASTSIVFLVFVNATQPFLIARLGESKRQGWLSGSLVFYDELISMFLALVWGSTADMVGTRPVAVLGYCVIALALYAYTFAERAWPDLLYARLVFAVGGSAVTAMLTGILHSYAAAAVTSNDEDEEVAERSTLLPVQQREPPPPSHGKLAALAGFATGMGALFAVFVLLPLPPRLAVDKSQDEGMRQTYYLVAVLALLVATCLWFALKNDAPSPTPPPFASVQEPSAEPTTSREERRRRMRARLHARRQADYSLATIVQGAKRLFRGTFVGFAAARHDARLTLAYVGGALARTSTIATTVFIPLLVTHFFYSSGQCSDLSSPDVPPDELKRRCRQAFVVASILSGIAQLTALLFAPVVGFLCDKLTPASTLFLSSVLATFSYAAIGLALPHNGDPRNAVAYVAAVGMGVGQIGAIVSSLALCAKAKNADSSSSGAIAGAYSATGGFSILLFSTLGGRLSDVYAPSAFLLMAGLAATTSLVSLRVMTL